MKLLINEKEYGLSWGMGAIEKYCDLNECDIYDLDAHISAQKVITRIKAINSLTYCAIENWCELQKPAIDIDFTLPEFKQWMNDQPQTTANDIVSDWKKSKTFGTTVAEYYFGENPEEEKPEPAKKKSKASASVKSTQSVLKSA